MTSILTNSAAMAALQTLRSIDNGLETAQSRVSSGMRVETAADNAAYWSIATTMRSDNRALATVQDALGLGAAKVDTAYAGLESAIEVVTEIRAKLVAATEEGVDKAKIQEEITQLQAQLVSIAEGASFSGENWLQADLTTAGGSVKKSVVASFVRNATGAVSVKTVDYMLDDRTVLFDEGGNLGILDKAAVIEGPAVALNINVGGTVTQHTVEAFTTDEVIAAGAGSSTFDGRYATDGVNNYVKVADDTWVIAVNQTTVPNQEAAYQDSLGRLWAVDTANVVAATTSSVDTMVIDNSTTTGQIDGLLKMVDTALEAMTSAAADLGAISTRIEMQESFVASLNDVIDKGIGRLVDADMNEESTRLKALQTQQQLGIQSLSIANSSAENILQLFRQ
ncbi:flagellin [Shinella yambaruensis]|uniref:flagellin N-terminal helical domain-containing protein n=1 Tax=Shinella TaxID=323620 RepID=UPI001FD4B149|nr:MULTISPECIES: flagellin [Shinella]CAI0340936.1 Flagellin D [Rhizobiaceae bacterium]CAK7259280.1 Flagellin D [Shinella sp. WSC3-e]MCJ8026135.1 flagellin [Shinella yambaruensis]MCO5136878.1 flagellin [Shinella sp.]MCU7978143.1 flagellin [Shinella yambaruensis]